MKVKFLLNSIKKPELLSTIEMKPGVSPFSGEEKEIPHNIDLSQGYCSGVLNEVVTGIQGYTGTIYRGCLERIGRYVFEVNINQMVYTVVFVINHVDDADTNIHVEIAVNNVESEKPFEVRYNRMLESLKVQLKDRLLQDWENCVWIYDDQSEFLCADLYPKIFRIENHVREFANMVLSRHLGIRWIEKYGLEKQKQSTDYLKIDFMQSLPEFRNISTTLYSMTLETLKKVLLKAKIYEADTTLAPLDMVRMETLLDARNFDGARQLLQGKKTVAVDIWKQVVSVYLRNPEEFEKQFTQFIKDRNHVAHNKLLTISAYTKIKAEIGLFDTEVTYGIKKFEEKNPSDEQLETYMCIEDQDSYDDDYEEQYWRDRIEGETGVKIRFSDEIMDMFVMTAQVLCEAISDRYHLDSCFEYAEEDEPQENSKVLIATVLSNASDRVLELYASITIDDDMEGSSEMEFAAVCEEETIAHALCTYQNGSGHEGDSGECIADIDSMYDTSTLKDFIENIFEYIENSLNPFVDKLSTIQYESVKNGGENPVADFPCQECGNYGVSVDAEFYPFGKCCYCGYENEVCVCESCGNVYDACTCDNSHLCNACVPRQDD